MYYIQDPFAHIPLVWEWLTALISKLACLVYAGNLPCREVRESDYNSFCLHVLELLEIYVANSLVPQFYVGFDFLAFCIHGLEDEHMAFSTTVCYDVISFFDEASVIVEAYLHTLFYNLADRDQILRDSRHMQSLFPNGTFPICWIG